MSIKFTVLQNVSDDTMNYFQFNKGKYNPEDRVTVRGITMSSYNAGGHYSIPAYALKVEGDLRAFFKWRKLAALCGGDKRMVTLGW